MLWGRPSRSPRRMRSIEPRSSTHIDSRKTSGSPRHWLPIQSKICLGDVGLGAVWGPQGFQTDFPGYSRGVGRPWACPDSSLRGDRTIKKASFAPNPNLNGEPRHRAGILQRRAQRCSTFPPVSRLFPCWRGLAAGFRGETPAPGSTGRCGRSPCQPRRSTKRNGVPAASGCES